MPKNKKEKLSYQIIGYLYQVYNALGYGYQEKYYQRAFELLLIKEKIFFKRELKVPINFEGKTIGRYFIDFVIEDKIAVELKVSNNIYQVHMQQVLGYIKSAQLKLGLLALFTNKGIKIKRYIN